MELSEEECVIALSWSHQLEAPDEDDDKLATRLDEVVRAYRIRLAEEAAAKQKAEALERAPVITVKEYQVMEYLKTYSRMDAEGLANAMQHDGVFLRMADIHFALGGLWKLGMVAQVPVGPDTYWEVLGNPLYRVQGQ